jgi:malonyl-CoA/methylmalonyl-CoA synthetase
VSSPPAVDPADWIERAARECPERTFLRTPEGLRITYLGLQEQSARFAAALASLGIAPGDRVAARVEKSPEAILLYLACLRMGAVFVPLNIQSTPNEVDAVLRDACPRVAVLPPEERAALTSAAEQAGAQRVATLGARGEGTLAELARTLSPGFSVAEARDENAPAAIVYTSGTTGRPKGAVLTRLNLASNATALARAWRFSGRDVLLHALPLHHVHGLFAAINTALASAAGMLLLPKFDVESVLTHLAEVTVYMGVPTHYTRLLKEPGLDRETTKHVRLFVSGSAPLSSETHQEFVGRTGHAILERYGMTETLMNTSNPYDGARVPGSVGPALPGVRIRVTEPQSGAVVAEPDSVGTLEVTGPNVFAGYFRDPEQTHATFTADRWFKTGDLGRIDRDGYVHIVGRAKDLVISGGYNVYPREVESELDSLPGVVESAVFGAPHPDFGEGVTAAVVLASGATLAEREIVEALRTRLSPYKIPKRVLFVAELPRNVMGKVQKNVLRATYASLYRTE